MSRLGQMEPIDRSTVWPYDAHGEPGAFLYQRYGHPTGAAAEAALGELEGGDALLGATVTRNPELQQKLYDARLRLGLSASPDSADSLLRGLKTLEMRMTRQTETAKELARRLESHRAVDKVRYPGFSSLISFDVADARRVETATTLIRNQTSLGGVTSSMESRHRWEGDRIPKGLLRLSVGLEDVEAVWADLDRALGTT